MNVIIMVSVIAMLLMAMTTILQKLIQSATVILVILLSLVLYANYSKGDNNDRLREESTVTSKLNTRSAT